MKRTISMMIGKGSVSHNRRTFQAENIDPERSHLNRCYVDEPIKAVYHKLFAEAVVRYNEKQTRSDRRIDDYYEKIRTGKQEKLSYEAIFQIGNKDDMGYGTQDWEKAAAVLDEFAGGFQERNPNLYLFSAYLHLDEATPHVHFDFVPYTTGSKRGLDTRVSLKAALAAQGFTSNGKQDTEWNRWVLAEKKELSRVMERHEIEWDQRGTKNEHLSVLNYKKEQRAKEVAELEKDKDDLLEKKDEIEKRIAGLERQEKSIELNVRKYDEDPEWQLPEPSAMTTAKAYKTKTVEPFIAKLKKVIRRLVAHCIELKSTVNKLQKKLWQAQDHVEALTDRLMEMENTNDKLRETAHDFENVKNAVGRERIDDILHQSKTSKVFHRCSISDRAVTNDRIACNQAGNKAIQQNVKSA